ncbi:MAG TPA: hypothetical protein ENJ60_12225 [Aeromonadales bacterium]|nr:hypothetical protein [Aeromonadales bacterium]
MNNRKTYNTEAFDFALKMKDAYSLLSSFFDLSIGLISGALAEEADSFFTNRFLERLLDNNVISDTDKKLREDYAEVISQGIIDDKAG